MGFAERTDQETVARLVGEHKPIVMITDPPYGIELNWRSKRRPPLDIGPPALHFMT